MKRLIRLWVSLGMLFLLAFMLTTGLVEAHSTTYVRVHHYSISDSGQYTDMGWDYTAVRAVPDAARAPLSLSDRDNDNDIDTACQNQFTQRDNTCTGQGPANQDCGDDQYFAEQARIDDGVFHPGNAPIGLVAMMWSPTCQSNWASVRRESQIGCTSRVPCYITSADIFRCADHPSSGPCRSVNAHYQTLNSSTTTDGINTVMVYAPVNLAYATGCIKEKSNAYCAATDPG